MIFLKEKLRPMKNFKSLFEQNWIQKGNAKPEVIRDTLQTGGRGETFIEKRQSTEINLIGYSFSSCII